MLGSTPPSGMPSGSHSDTTAGDWQARIKKVEQRHQEELRSVRAQEELKRHALEATAIAVWVVQLQGYTIEER